MDQVARATTDTRLVAVRRALAGEDVGQVADELGFEPALVERWLAAFLAGGAAALAGQAPTDPAARDRFLALISHEVRTPITVVSGWIDTLRSMGVDQVPAEVLDAALTAMRGHADRLTRLADDLLDSAAVSLGRLQLRLADVDLSAIAEDVVSSLRSERIEAEIAGSLPMRGDGTRLGQIVTNLCNDALARTSRGIRVEVGPAGAPRTHEIRVLVPGTPPPFEEMLALFEPFDRGTGGAHSGLGLYVCRALAVAHGGTCGVDAEDDHLSFWVRLPVAGPSEAVQAAPVAGRR